MEVKFAPGMGPVDGDEMSAAALLEAFKTHCAAQDEPIPMRLQIVDVQAGGAAFEVLLFDSEESATLKIVETGASVRPDDVEAGKNWVEATK